MTWRVGGALFVAFVALSACGAGSKPDPGRAPSEPPTSAPDTASPPANDAAAPGAAADLRCTFGAVADPLTHDALAAPGSYPVGRMQLTFVDTARRTPANGSYGGAAERRLSTLVYYPAQKKQWWQVRADIAKTGGPFPLVVYSHGYSSSNLEASDLASHLASHGFIVAAPTFPLSNLLAPGGATIRDVVEQPGDVKTVIDQMLAKSAASGDVFAGAVDAQRIAAAGLSLGGLTTLLAAYHRRLGDPRIRAAVAFAAPSALFAADYYQRRPLPLLVLHGDIDAFVDYQLNARTSLDRQRPNVTLVSVRAGSHAGFSSLDPQFLFDALGKLVAPKGSNPNNPDALGCGVVAQRLGAQASSLDEGFFKRVGGAEDGIIVPAPGQKVKLPCEGDNINKPAIDAEKQLAIARRAALAFLQATFAADATERARHCHYLRSVLPTDANVTVE
ncbi:MAG: hypothetical protein KC503_11980 [Myxococcales bacterium]|nr:hypothetical protein [Myxococcales bacterium]